jgi:two-component system chemotaxis sensor kinase CheA
LSDREAFALIFEPGFSTSRVTSAISGRGVGLDVVKRAVDHLRGNILVDSLHGTGTTFTLVLPLTAAIIDGMTVRIGSETYIVPVLTIIESLRPDPSMLTTVKGSGEVLMFRGNLLPLFRLSELFDVPDANPDACESIVIVLEDAGKRAAILVDDLLGQQQTVVKSLGRAFGAVVGVSGASIMADGKPGLILDVPGLIKLATNGSRTSTPSVRPEATEQTTKTGGVRDEQKCSSRG